jgi:hypothetical protein
MAIRRSTRTRAVEAVRALLLADADILALTNDGASCHLQQYDAMGPHSTMDLRGGRQIHIYPGDAVKVAGMGKLWTQSFDIIIEFFSPRDAVEHVLGGNSITDEAEHIIGLLWVGQSTPPGRLIDPDNPPNMITQIITRIIPSEATVADGESAVRRTITITFETQQKPDGKRPYEA